MPKPKLDGMANGIEYQLQYRGVFYSMRFTDPRSHQRQRVPTKCSTPLTAHAFAANFLQGFTPGQSTGKVTVGELVEAVLAEKKAHQPRDFKEKSRNWELRLRDKFAAWDHRDLTPKVLADYKAWAQGQPAPAHYGWAPIAETTGVIAPATVNLDLALLSVAYNRGLEHQVISYRPKVRKFSDKELRKFIRKGFLVQSQFDRIMALPLPVWLKAMLSVAYTAGNRAGELRQMRVCQVDLLNRIVRLNPGETKNSDGRVVGMTEQMFQLLTACTWGKGPDDYVFTRDDRGQSNGDGPVGDFRKLWDGILEQAGMPHRVTLHDFRRSAVRNMLRRGIDLHTAMRIGGWRTTAMVGRYNVVVEEDMVAAARKIEEGARVERAMAQEQATNALSGPPVGHGAESIN